MLQPASGRCGARADLFAALESVDERHGAAPHLLLVADVDGFRAFNARHGYAVGDATLHELQRRASDVAASFRIGADSLALLLEGDVPVLLPLVGHALDRLTLTTPEPLQCSFGV